MSHKSLLPKELLIEVKERNPEKLDIPVDCIAFQFFDVIGREDKNNHKEKARKHSNRVNISNLYYVDATIKDKDQVTKERGEDCLLLFNMSVNGWEKVVQCKNGHIEPLRVGDIFVTT